jgi:hypothetical protein
MLKEGDQGKEEEECPPHYEAIMQLAGEEQVSTPKRKHHDSGEKSGKRVKNGSIKLRTPHSHVGDAFLRDLNIRRRDIAVPITSRQMLFYLLWRNLYWTRFYGLAAVANTLSHGRSMGMIVPFERLVDYLEIMFLKVEPFLPNNSVPDRKWIKTAVYALSKGPRRILQIHPVVNNFTGEKLTEASTSIFDSTTGVSIVNERFCKKFNRAFLGESTEKEEGGINPGIILLHRQWLVSLLF